MVFIENYSGCQRTAGGRYHENQMPTVQMRFSNCFVLFISLSNINVAKGQQLKGRIHVYIYV